MGIDLYDTAQFSLPVVNPDKNTVPAGPGGHTQARYLGALSSACSVSQADPGKSGNG